MDAGPDDEDPVLASQSLFDELGIELNFAPDELGPPVDEQRLQRFHHKQLSRAEETEICQLIAGFHAWYAAWCQLVRHDSRGGQSDERRWRSTDLNNASPS